MTEKLTRTSYRDPATDGERDGSTARRESLLDHEQFFRPLERAHNLAVHSPGVATGLEVRAGENTDRLSVLPGIALDNRGNHIVLAKDAQAIVADTRITVTDQGAEVPIAGLADGDYVLTIAWAETFDRRTFDDSEGRRYQTDHTPRIVLRPVADGAVDTGVTLAEASLLGGVVTQLRPGGRVHSRSRLSLHGPGPDNSLNVGEAVVGTVRARPDNGLDLAASGTSLSISPGRIVAGRDTAEAALTLDTVTGNLGIGTTTPGARLHVTGGAILAESGAGDAGIGFRRGAGGLGGYVRYIPDRFPPSRLTIGVEDESDSVVFEHAGSAQLEIRSGEVLVTGLLGAQQLSASTLTARTLAATGDVRLGADGQVRIGGRSGIFLQLSDKLWFYDPHDADNADDEIWIRSGDDSTFGKMTGFFLAPCSATFKQEIERLDEAALRSLHDDLMRTPVSNFSYRGTRRRSLGIVLEDCPAYLVHGNGINPVEYAAWLHGALQALSNQVTELAARLTSEEAPS